MPPRSAKMKRRILGFQRRVWWPKWTAASSSSRMETVKLVVAIEKAPSIGWVTYAGRGRGAPLIARGTRATACPPGSGNRTPERLAAERRQGGSHPWAEAVAREVCDSDVLLLDLLHVRLRASLRC